MGFNVTADLVPLFRGLVTGLQPFAAVQDVQLLFESTVANLHASYNRLIADQMLLMGQLGVMKPQSEQLASASIAILLC